MMHIDVVNRRNTSGDNDGEYVGRPSPLGNPFELTSRSAQARDEVIARYRRWIKTELKDNPTGAAATEFNRLCDRYRMGRTLTLVCWCAPKPCHADVIAALIKSVVV